jgi:hypothetical protein
MLWVRSVSSSRTLLTITRFGAVLEEFEVRDALESVLYTKPDLMMAGNGY